MIRAASTLIAALLPFSTAAAATLTITLDRVSNDKGSVRVFLYSTAENFRDEARSLAQRVVPASPDIMTVRFSDLTPGTYAVIAYHDEDGNGRMNRLLGMIPTEGWGLSNNPALMGPPRFAEAAFTLSPEGREIAVTLNY